MDEDLPRSLAAALTAAGLEAAHVVDAGLRGQSDTQVLAEAIRHGRALVTGDLGFSNLLRFPLGEHAGNGCLRSPPAQAPARQPIATRGSLNAVARGPHIGHPTRRPALRRPRQA